LCGIAAVHPACAVHSMNVGWSNFNFDKMWITKRVSTETKLIEGETL
jgi:hypothetical protein